MRLSALGVFPLLAVLAPLVGASAPLSPEPAACTAALVDAVRADLNGREARVSALAEKARAENILLVDDARAALLRAGDDRLGGARLRARDPFSYAGRLEALRPALAKGEWEKGVGLWTDWLRKTQAAWERVDAAEYCGLREEGRSFAQDGYLMLLPFIAAAKGDDELIPVAHLAAASGAISLGLDVAAFVPNVALSAGRKLSKNAHIRRSARAFRRFADFVEAREKERGLVR
jgi:hypothetical protein